MNFKTRPSTVDIRDREMDKRLLLLETINRNAYNCKNCDSSLLHANGVFVCKNCGLCNGVDIRNTFEDMKRAKTNQKQVTDSIEAVKAMVAPLGINTSFIRHDIGNSAIIFQTVHGMTKNTGIANAQGGRKLITLDSRSSMSANSYNRTSAFMFAICSQIYTRKLNTVKNGTPVHVAIPYSRMAQYTQDKSCKRLNHMWIASHLVETDKHTADSVMESMNLLPMEIIDNLVYNIPLIFNYYWKQLRIYSIRTKEPLGFEMDMNLSKIRDELIAISQVELTLHLRKLHNFEFDHKFLSGVASTIARCSSLVHDVAFILVLLIREYNGCTMSVPEMCSLRSGLPLDPREMKRFIDDRETGSKNLYSTIGAATIQPFKALFGFIQNQVIKSTKNFMGDFVNYFKGTNWLTFSWGFGKSLKSHMSNIKFAPYAFLLSNERSSAADRQQFLLNSLEWVMYSIFTNGKFSPNSGTAQQCWMMLTYLNLSEVVFPVLCKDREKCTNQLHHIDTSLDSRIPHPFESKRKNPHLDRKDGDVCEFDRRSGGQSCANMKQLAASGHMQVRTIAALMLFHCENLHPDTVEGICPSVLRTIVDVQHENHIYPNLKLFKRREPNPNWLQNQDHNLLKVFKAICREEFAKNIENALDLKSISSSKIIQCMRNAQRYGLLPDLIQDIIGMFNDLITEDNTNEFKMAISIYHLILSNLRHFSELANISELMTICAGFDLSAQITTQDILDREEVTVFMMYKWHREIEKGWTSLENTSQVLLNIRTQNIPVRLDFSGVFVRLSSSGMIRNSRKDFVNFLRNWSTLYNDRMASGDRELKNYDNSSFGRLRHTDIHKIINNFQSFFGYDNIAKALASYLELDQNIQTPCTKRYKKSHATGVGL